jgi:hypothetical protein
MITIAIQDNLVVVRASYNSGFIAAAKALQAKYSGEDKTWSFTQDFDTVNTLIQTHYRDEVLLQEQLNKLTAKRIQLNCDLEDLDIQLAKLKQKALKLGVKL